MNGLLTDLFSVLNHNAFWDSSSVDQLVASKLKSVIGYAKQLAQERDLWVPWLYLNYALPDEPVYEGYSTAQLQRLHDTKDKYDPENAFGRLWSGGFKL
jgi:hypothetical protein